MVEWMTFDVKTLHEIERKLIKALANGKLTLDALTQQAGLNVDQVRRGIEWLKYKNLININEKVTRFLSIGSEGAKAVQGGLPERKLVNSLRLLGEIAISDAKNIPVSMTPNLTLRFQTLEQKDG